LEALFTSNETELTKLTCQDIIAIIDMLQSKNITIRQPLYKHLIYPILLVQVAQNNIDAIKALLKLDEQLTSYQAYSHDTTYSWEMLLEQGLTIAPNDTELLKLSEQTTRNYLTYTLHEIPIGVIYGEDGATIAECDELLEKVIQYENLCNELQFDERELIENCKFYYTAYKAYLAVYQNYQNFEDYLNKTYQQKR
ncbi:MAG: hypothetical protein JHD28_10555, partial [Bacteroidia bacterium]|nr:hypothetical protein [Bacteroidia bacterium]